MKLPKAIILDRDGCINVSSSDDTSKFYYILDFNHFIIKPGVNQALEIIRALEIPTALITKQRCISKGLTSKERVAMLHTRLERITNFDFTQIYVEEQNPTKAELYRKVLADLPKINPQEIWLFDDSIDERAIASKMGITTFDGTNLYEAVCKAFELK